jgi:hypothetical protein
MELWQECGFPVEQAKAIGINRLKVIECAFAGGLVRAIHSPSKRKSE